MLAETTIYGLTLPGLVIVAAGFAYVVSLIRDWRPIRALRQENGELRRTIAEQQDRLGKQDVRIAELENDLARMKRVTDLSPIAEQQRKQVEVLEQLVQEVKSLDGAVRANTAAVEILAKRKVIDDAIDEGDNS